MWGDILWALLSCTIISTSIVLGLEWLRRRTPKFPYRWSCSECTFDVSGTKPIYVEQHRVYHQLKYHGGKK